jgi:hypothetical protein
MCVVVQYSPYWLGRSTGLALSHPFLDAVRNGPERFPRPAASQGLRRNVCRFPFLLSMIALRSGISSDPGSSEIRIGKNAAKRRTAG